MASATIPKDLTKVKPKLLFNLTKRQLVCFGSGALVGVPLFLWLKDSIPTSAASLIMVVTMMPFFLFGLYEKNGQPLEKLLRHIIQARHVRPRHRPYQTDNFYAALSRQIKLDKEVKAIVKNARSRNQADAGREKTDRRRHRAGQA